MVAADTAEKEDLMNIKQENEFAFVNDLNRFNKWGSLDFHVGTDADKNEDMYIKKENNLTFQ